MSTEDIDGTPDLDNQSEDATSESSSNLRDKCSACKSSRITERVRFLCSTCNPDNSTDYYCHYCVVQHLGQDHHVTDQKGALLDICDKHKNVNMFLCETCDLQLLCAECIPEHQNHPFWEISVNEKKVADIYKTVHEVLTKSDVVYKQIVKCLEKIRVSTESFDQLLDRYNEDCVAQLLTEVFLKSLEKTRPQIKGIVNENIKQRGDLVDAKELFDEVLTDTGDTQAAMRQVLASSILKAAKVYSEKLVQNHSEKQNQDRKIPMPYIKQSEIESHDNNVEQALEKLCDEIAKLISELIKTIRFEGLSTAVIDVYARNPGFIKFKKPVDIDAGIKIASCEAFFFVCFRDDTAGKMKVYSSASIEGACASIFNVPVATFSVASGPNFINTTHTAASFNCKTASNNVATAMPGIAWNEMIGTFLNGNSKVALINSKQISDGTAWQLDYAIVGGYKIQLCPDKKYPEKPYSFSAKLAAGSTQPGEVNIACISEDSMHLISISGAVEREHGSLRICCENKQLEHRGRYGCAFFQIETQQKEMLIANWCLECKLLEIIRIETEKGFPQTNLSNEVSRVGKLELRFDDLHEICMFKKSCIVVTKQQQIFTCADIFELIELWK